MMKVRWARRRRAELSGGCDDRETGVFSPPVRGAARSEPSSSSASRWRTGRRSAGGRALQVKEEDTASLERDPACPVLLSQTGTMTQPTSRRGYHTLESL